MSEKDDCPMCGGIGCVCLACDLAIDDCECFEDAEPCPCEKCDGTGIAPFEDEPATTEDNANG